MSEMDMMRKIYSADVKQADNLTFEATITTAAKDRQGEVVLPEGAQLDNYMQNPVVLFAHRYADPPVARALEIRPEGNGLVARFQFPEPGTYDFADTVRKLWASGFLNAVSIGFIPKRWEDESTIAEWELLEFSIVPVPANQEALRRILEPQEIKKVIPYKRTPLAPEDAPWDGPKEVAAADVEDLRVMCAWYDAENPDVKSSYKLPHHKADGEHACVWRGVAAAMAALLGGRGGVDIPDSDRRGVYNHLAKHYRDFDKEPPEFKEPGEKTEVKEGRVLSAKNRELIQNAVQQMKEAIAALEDLLEATEPPEKDVEPDTAAGTEPDIADEGLAEGVVEQLTKLVKELQEVLT